MLKKIPYWGTSLPPSPLLSPHPPLDSAFHKNGWWMKNEKPKQENELAPNPWSDVFAGLFENWKKSGWNKNYYLLCLKAFLFESTLVVPKRHHNQGDKMKSKPSGSLSNPFMLMGMTALMALGLGEENQNKHPPFQHFYLRHFGRFKARIWIFFFLGSLSTPNMMANTKCKLQGKTQVWDGECTPYSELTFGVVTKLAPGAVAACGRKIQTPSRVPNVQFTRTNAQTHSCTHTKHSQMHICKQICLAHTNAHKEVQTHQLFELGSQLLLGWEAQRVGSIRVFLFHVPIC